LEPEAERQIERILILGDKPVMRRPIPAAAVLDALPKACQIDEALCERVRRYLAKYTQDSGITNLSVEGATTSGAERPVPNRYGLRSSSAWNGSAQAFIQPSDYLIASAGVVAYDGVDGSEADPAGTMLSMGFDWAQLDVGYRPHWFSPFTDSSMLISSEAATMGSVTLSNYQPLTRFGFTYEMFVARMKRSQNIAVKDGTELITGHPRLAGIQLAIEPVSGWSLAINRLMQYGGGSRGGNSIGDLVDAFFRPAQADNAEANNIDNQLGNQVGSITSRFLVPSRVPFAVYFEYAGEDTSRGKNYFLGNSALSMGVQFPRLFNRFDLTYEVSEWQDGWYEHHIYRDGLTNNGLVIGHWGADLRQFGNGVGAQSQMVRLGWQPQWGGLLELKYRTLDNESYSSVLYERAHDWTARYSMPVKSFTVGAEYFGGQDEYGESFSRVSAFVRYTPNGAGGLTLLADEMSERLDDFGAEVFIDAGANMNQVKIDLTDELPRTKTERQTAPHFAIGARREFSAHSDLGARIEYDEINGRSLIGARAVDYRYRFGNHLAIGGFLGAARYDLDTPAYGMYGGIGLQLRNLLPGWDIGAEAKYATKVARDHLLSTDPSSIRPDSFYDITTTTLFLTKRF
jgi:hypothetical protein